jgi:sugar phosphate permease
VLPRRDTFAIWTVLGAAALIALMWLPQERWQDLALFGLTGAFFYGSNAVVGALLTDLYPTRMRTTAYAACGSAPLSIGFALFPALVPLVVQSMGWQWSFSVMIAPLLLVAALAALALPRLRSGRDVDEG